MTTCWLVAWTVLFCLFHTCLLFRQHCDIRRAPSGACYPQYGLGTTLLVIEHYSHPLHHSLVPLYACPGSYGSLLTTTANINHLDISCPTTITRHVVQSQQPPRAQGRLATSYPESSSHRPCKPGME